VIFDPVECGIREHDIELFDEIHIVDVHHQECQVPSAFPLRCVNHAMGSVDADHFATGNKIRKPCGESAIATQPRSRTRSVPCRKFRNELRSHSFCEWMPSYSLPSNSCVIGFPAELILRPTWMKPILPVKR
jgi:hypothetical protein